MKQGFVYLLNFRIFSAYQVKNKQFDA